MVFLGGVVVGIKFILPSAGFPSRSLKCKSGKTGDVSRPEEEDLTRLGDRIDAKIFLRSFRHRSALSLSLSTEADDWTELQKKFFLFMGGNLVPPPPRRNKLESKSGNSSS